MKIILKFFLTIAMMLSSYHSNQMMQNFIKFFPYNIGAGRAYSDEAKVCICGVTVTNMIGSNLGSKIAMYKLVQAEFNWKKAETMPTYPNWNDQMMAETYTSDGGWYGPMSSAFILYKVQKKIMQGVLSGYQKILKDATGEEVTVGDCQEYVGFFPQSFRNVFAAGKKANVPGFGTYSERKGLAGEIGISDYFEVGEEDKSRGSVKPVYPIDYTNLDANQVAAKGVTVKNLEKGKIGVRGVMGVEKINGVVCPIDYGKRKTVYMLLDSGVKRTFVPANLKESKKNFQYKDAMEFMVEAKGFLALSVHKSYRNSINAFMFENDMANDDQLRDPGFVKDHVILPNTLDIEFCYSLLRSSIKDAFFGITEEMWDTAFDKYRKQCPILGMSTGMVYSRRIEGQLKYFRYYGMLEKPVGFLDVKGDKKVPGGGFLYEPDIDSIQVVVDGGYDGKIETIDQGIQTSIETIEKKAEEKEVIPIPEPIVEIPVITQEEINQKVQEITGIEPKEDSPEKSVEVSEASGDNIEIIEETPEETDATRRCKQRLSEVEIEVSGQIPDSISAVKMLIKKMMNYPHVRACDDIINLIFTLNGVHQRNPPMLVLKWNITEVDPKVLEANGQNPNNKVFEIRFYNDYFDDQKEILLYIPATEIVNNWDQYTLILFDFIDWVDSQLAKILTLNGLFEEFSAGIKKKLVGAYGNWIFDLGPSGPTRLEGSSQVSDFEEMLKNNDLPYLFLIIRLVHTNGEFYDLVYQSWMLGEKYLMMKISGTQLNFQVMVNKYSSQAKLNQIFNSVYDMLRINYFDNDGIVSLIGAKKVTFKALKEEGKFLGFQLNSLGLEGKEYEEPKQGHAAMLSGDDNAFLFSINATQIETPYVVRGFVHNRENIPVLNLFFSTEYFQSEYIVPLSKVSSFYVNMQTLFRECFRHLVMLINQVGAVENGTLSGDDLAKAQEMGRYSLTELSEKVLSMLSSRAVYGCVKTMRVADSESEQDPETGQPLPGQPKENTKPGKKYKWSMPTQWDPSGELLILKANRKFAGAATKCEAAEMHNPTLIHLYPTYLDEVEGYALTVNDISSDGSSEVKTTYHFVKYQDYAHMKVFEDFIEGVLNKLFGTTGKPDGGGERI